MDKNVSTKMCVYYIIKGIQTFKLLFQVMEVLFFIFTKLLEAECVTVKQNNVLSKKGYTSHIYMCVL